MTFYRQLDITDRNVGLVLMFSDTASKNGVVMERHTHHCRQGLWNVFYMPWEGDVLDYDAVMDDFGNLVRIR